MTTNELPYLENKISVSLAADMLGLSRQAVHDMTKSGKLRAWRVPSVTTDLVVVDLRQVEQLKASTARVVSVTP